jgi:flagellar biogenesis protein FliO
MLSAMFVLGLLAALLWWLKRRQSPWSQHGPGRRIRLIETQPLGLKHKMMLVQVDQQMVLVAVNANDIRTLHSWPCSAIGPDGQVTPAGDAANTSFPDFVAGGRS